VPVPEAETKWGTIAGDLEALVGTGDLTSAAFLFPRSALPVGPRSRGARRETVDHAPVDVHVGSIAVRRFIEARQRS